MSKMSPVSWERSAATNAHSSDVISPVNSFRGRRDRLVGSPVKENVLWNDSHYIERALPALTLLLRRIREVPDDILRGVPWRQLP